MCKDGSGDKVLMVANGNLTFMPMSDENIRVVKNRLTHIPAGSPAISPEEVAPLMKDDEENKV